MQQILQCPNCTTLIPAEKINVDMLVAVCPECNTLFNFGKGLSPAGASKPEISMPPGVEVFEWPGEMEIIYKWRNGTSAFLVFFTILWNLILSVFVVMAIFTGEYSMLLFTSVHILVGVGLIYFTLASLLNMTHVVVDERRLWVEHRPLKIPFFPSRNVPITDVEQLFVKKYISSRTNGNPNYNYEVSAVLKGGERLSLIKQLNKPNQARYIEQEVERYLEITDRPVDEEWQG